ncbi:OprD family outer membrane porin [Providencia hangzhouensis]|uniref:OprD family outer membrane porin n=1 Tax=Providencia hangzhouensis TaxID=3031799 RepID=UPI0034DCF6CC
MNKGIGFAIPILSLLILSQNAFSSNESNGFIDGAKGNLLLRNYFINKNYVGDSAVKNYSREWTQNFILEIKSGYTPGVIGFGVDGLGLLSVKLDGGRGTTGTGLLPDDSPHSYGYVGATAKSKFSKSELRYGDLRPRNPMVIATDTRSLPQVFRGLDFSSKEIDGLELQFSVLQKGKSRVSEDMETLTYNKIKGGDFYYGGGKYVYSKDTSFSLWSSKFEDIYQQNYVNLTQFYNIDNVRLGADLNYWWGKDTGSSKAGKLDNKTFSSALTAQYGGNKLIFGYQHLEGSSKWMRLDGAGGGFLSNDSLSNSFDSPKERSYQIRHEYDFTHVGVPGLKIMNRYTKGTNIHNKFTDNGREWVRETELYYTFQTGALKKLSVSYKNITLRQTHGTRNENENRITFNYPLGLF